MSELITKVLTDPSIRDSQQLSESIVREVSASFCPWCADNSF